MHRTEKFWNRIAARYARTPIKDQATYERKLATTREYLDADSRVLEIGCGTGSTAIEHAPFVAHILATDISGSMIDIARRRAAEAGITNIEFERRGADELDFPGAGFDVVLCLNIIHLLEEPGQTLADLHDLLRPGGVLISSTACIGDRQAYLKPILWLAAAVGAIPRVQVFNSDSLRGMFAAAGFKVVEEWQYGRSVVAFTVLRRD